MARRRIMGTVNGNDLHEALHPCSHSAIVGQVRDMAGILARVRGVTPVQPAEGSDARGIAVDVLVSSLTGVSLVGVPGRARG